MVMPFANDTRALGLGSGEATNATGSIALSSVDERGDDSNPRFFNCPFQQ